MRFVFKPTTPGPGYLLQVSSQGNGEDPIPLYWTGWAYTSAAVDFYANKVFVGMIQNNQVGIAMFSTSADNGAYALSFLLFAGRFHVAF